MKRGADGTCECTGKLTKIVDNKCECDDTAVYNETTKVCECPSYATEDTDNGKCTYPYYWKGKLSELTENINAANADKELIKGYSVGSATQIPCRFEEGGAGYSGYIDLDNPTACTTVNEDNSAVKRSTDASSINIILPKTGKPYVYNYLSNYKGADTGEAYRYGWTDGTSGASMCRIKDTSTLGHWKQTEDGDWKCFAGNALEGKKGSGSVEFLYDPEKVK